MPEVTVTTWTCTRCGGTRELEGRDQPEDWVKVVTLMPPRAAPSEAEFLGDLCTDCALALGYFMRHMTVAGGT